MKVLPIEIFLDENVYNVKAFNRTKTAHHNHPFIISDVAYNEVDSVVYIKNKTNLPTDFVGGRKYSYAIECLEGSITLEYASKSSLNLTTAYDDHSDEEHFKGLGECVELTSNTIAIFELDEAFNYKSIDGSFIEYKIAKDGGIK